MEHIQEKEPPDVITSDAENQTQIRPSEAPADKREKFERFRAYNSGLWNGPRRENKELMFKQDNLHVYDAISSKLSLTGYQQDRGRKAIENIDLDDLTGPDATAPMVAWAVCVIVANDDVNDGTRYWPHPDSARDDKEFEEIADSLGMDLSKQMSLLQRVIARTDV